MIKLKIKDILDNRNKTMYWLAKQTDLTYPTIYRMIKEETEGIQFHTLEEIMIALDITDFNDVFKFVDDGRQ
jgi:putative transcriptional regulator